MKSDNHEIIYCTDADENRIYCKSCYELFMERYYKNHLKSGTHINIIHKRQRLNNTNINK